MFLFGGLFYKIYYTHLYDKQQNLGLIHFYKQH